MIKERSEIQDENKWKVEALYPSMHKWQCDFDQICKKNQNLRWPEISTFKGKLGESPDNLKKTLDALFSIDRKLSKIYTYAHLRHDEDITENSHKVAHDQVTSILHDFGLEIAWFEPELLALPEDTLQNYLDSPALADYRFHLEKIIRLKKHTLSTEKEELLALSSKALNVSHKSFSALNDADFKFGVVKNSKNEELQLTHASFGIYVRDQDRTLRENSFKQFHQKFLNYENTLAELINGQIQSHIFNARARNYSNSLEAALFPKNIDTAVYHALIQAVEEEIHVLHRYINLRQKVLNVGPLSLYDMYVPLTPQVDIKMSYKEAEDIVIESVAPLGTTYQNALKKGFKDERWVDRFENKNKRSGAYSSGCYDSFPYILMNYKGILRDVFTLAHEAGHSMHSLLSHQNQPYQYGNYPIFLAEVASTFNEELLNRLLMERMDNKEKKIFLINQKIEDIRTTLFRQTMFAEFELFLHETAEKDIPLTPKLLKEKYRQLNVKYFGEQVIIDKEADIEWARIPHFYYNFYVYQYATGISAALALTDRVLQGGKEERDAYLSFLKSGSSRYPIDTLKLAGVDMRSTLPVKTAIHKFETLVNELNQLLTES